MSDELVWAILTLAGFSAAILTVVLWVVTNALRSKSGKIIDSVKRSRTSQLLLAVTPTHRGNLFMVKPFLSGVLETAKFKERVRKKRKVFYEPKYTEVELGLNDLERDPAFKDMTDEQKVESLKLTQECLNFMLKANTEKVFLEDNVPLTLALEDKVISTGVKGVGALAFFEKLCKIKELKAQIKNLEESKEHKEIAEYLKTLLSRVTPINVDVLRNYWDSTFNQTDDESVHEAYYTQGRRDEHGERGGTEKLFIYGGIAFAIIGVVAGAILAFLGGK